MRSLENSNLNWRLSSHYRALYIISIDIGKQCENRASEKIQVVCGAKEAFSSPEAAILLVSTKNRDLWPNLVPRAISGSWGTRLPRVSPNFWACAEKSLYNFQPIRFVRFDNESVNRGLPVLGAARGLDSWCWPKGSRPLGTRMPKKPKELFILARARFAFLGFVKRSVGSSRGTRNAWRALIPTDCQVFLSWISMSRISSLLRPLRQLVSNPPVHVPVRPNC